MRNPLANRLLDIGLSGWMIALLVFLYIPIVTLAFFSFADSRVLTFPVQGFTLNWYRELFERPDFLPALRTSALVAVATMLVSTVLGTCGAILWMRYRFRFKQALQALTFLPVLFPQLLLGVMLLLWFSVLGTVFDFRLGIPTLIIGHVIYVTPFVMIIVAVQLYGFDDTVEDAARDAGASDWRVLVEITLPMIWPGISAAMIMAFLLSWGNFYLSYSLNGSMRTLPIFIYSGITVGSSPIYPALATLNFIPAMGLVVLADFLRRRALRRDTGAAEEES